MKNDTAIKIWEQSWPPETHTTDYALKRIKSAASAKLTPTKIDTTEYYGYFQGTHGRYETQLHHCPCGDFHRGKLPCKHIYRLAIELGLIDVDVKRDLNAVVTPKNERMSLDATIDIVETLSQDAQRKLCLIASNIRTTTPTYKMSLDSDVAELIKSKIIIDAAADKHEINFGTKSDIFQFLDREQIPYKKSAKKSELIEICMEYVPEKARKEFGEIISVSIPGKFSSQKIHYYLHRKYDYQYSYYDDVNFEKIPLLDTDLPDDAITEQLIKRGYYSRK